MELALHRRSYMAEMAVTSYFQRYLLTLFFAVTIKRYYLKIKKLIKTLYFILYNNEKLPIHVTQLLPVR